jgi:hypothetical protein
LKWNGIGPLVKGGLSFLIPRRFVKLSEPVFGRFNFGAELKGIMRDLEMRLERPMVFRDME